MRRWILLLFLMGLFTMSANAAVKVEKTEYKGWPNCYRVSNGEMELIVTADVGPRMIRFGFVGGQNLFKEYQEQLGKSGEEKFQLRGGSRVWKAPEDPIATWAPDNVPVNIKTTPTGLIATAPMEPVSMLQKEIEVSMEAFRFEGHGFQPHHQPFPLRAGIFSLGADHDGAGRHGDYRVSSAREASRKSGSDQSLGHVGLHQSRRQALEVYPQISDFAAGPEQPRRTEAGNV